MSASMRPSPVRFFDVDGYGELASTTNQIPGGWSLFFGADVPVTYGLPVVHHENRHHGRDTLDDDQHPKQN